MGGFAVSILVPVLVIVLAIVCIPWIIVHAKYDVPENKNTRKPSCFGKWVSRKQRHDLGCAACKWEVQCDTERYKEIL